MDELKGLREGKPWKPIDKDPELDIDPNILPPMKRGGPVNQDAMNMAVWGKGKQNKQYKTMNQDAMRMAVTNKQLRKLHG